MLLLEDATEAHWRSAFCVSVMALWSGFFTYGFETGAGLCCWRTGGMGITDGSGTGLGSDGGAGFGAKLGRLVW